MSYFGLGFLIVERIRHFCFGEDLIVIISAIPITISRHALESINLKVVF